MDKAVFDMLSQHLPRLMKGKKSRKLAINKLFTTLSVKIPKDADTLEYWNDETSLSLQDGVGIHFAFERVSSGTNKIVLTSLYVKNLRDVLYDLLNKKIHNVASEGKSEKQVDSDNVKKVQYTKGVYIFIGSIIVLPLAWTLLTKLVIIKPYELDLGTMVSSFRRDPDENTPVQAVSSSDAPQITISINDVEVPLGARGNQVPVVLDDARSKGILTNVFGLVQDSSDMPYEKYYSVRTEFSLLPDYPASRITSAVLTIREIQAIREPVIEIESWVIGEENVINIYMINNSMGRAENVSIQLKLYQGLDGWYTKRNLLTDPDLALLEDFFNCIPFATSQSIVTAAAGEVRLLYRIPFEPRGNLTELDFSQLSFYQDSIVNNYELVACPF